MLIPRYEGAKNDGFSVTRSLLPLGTDSDDVASTPRWIGFSSDKGFGLRQRRELSEDLQVVLFWGWHGAANMCHEVTPHTNA
jgi:hypothetical protein